MEAMARSVELQRLAREALRKDAAERGEDGDPGTGGDAAGWQPGVLKVTKYSDAHVYRSTLVDTSENSLRAGQIDDAHRRLLNDMRVSASTADEGAGEFTFKRKCSSVVVPIDCDSDDEDNQFVNRFVAKRICGAAGGPGAGSASSGSGGGGHPSTSGLREERVAKSSQAPKDAPKGKRRKVVHSGGNGHSAIRIRRDAERDAVSLTMLEAEQVLGTASNEHAMKMLDCIWAKLTGILVQ